MPQLDPDISLGIDRETAAGLAATVLVVASGQTATTAIGQILLVPAAGLLRPGHGLASAGSAVWLRVGRAIEQYARRRRWPARGFYVDGQPPAGLAALPARHLILQDVVGDPRRRPGFWFVPFAGGGPLGANAVEPPPQVAAAAARGLRPLGADLLVVPAADSLVWTIECQVVAAVDSTGRACLTGQAGAGRALHQLIGRSGYLLCDGEPVLLNCSIPAGSEIIALAPPARPGGVQAEAGALTIVYEDQSLLVVNKPPGVLVHPARGRGTGTLANLVAAHLEAQGLSGVVRPTGRLDRGTSGLVIFAKTRHAHHALAEQTRRGQRRRTYLALCSPAPVSRGDVLCIEAAIVSPPIDSSRYPEPRPARTEARVLLSCASGTIVQVELATGRTHQIRQHLASVGLWLWGDLLYGGKDGPIDRPALHAWRAEFAHPVTGARVALHAPLPPDMRDLLRWFRQGG